MSNISGIQFTQYMMPDGHKEEMVIDRPPEIEEQAEQLKALDPPAIFEMEMLRDYRTISLTIERDSLGELGDTEVLASEMVPNGPEIPEAVDRLVIAAYDAVIGR